MNVPHTVCKMQTTAIVNERTNYVENLVVDVEIVLSVEVDWQLEHERRVAATHHKLASQHSANSSDRLTHAINQLLQR